ncbi:MAG: CHAT domain-containing protein [Steroidobacteraceae bacterium]
MTQQDPQGYDVTPYDRMAWSDVEAERLLASGERKRELTAYFGSELYEELRGLAQKSATRGPGRGTVWIVPGMMATQLGLPRPAPLPNDVLWLDPIDIAIGRLTALAWRENSAVRALGVVLFAGLKLKLTLSAAGFAPRFFHYDWRRPIRDLGHEFAAAMRGGNDMPLAIVGHSMGGLVTRAALRLDPAIAVRHVVLLGTPNLGTHASAQALRGTYPVVRKVAMLDLRHSAETLTRSVFASFPGLHDMLPRDDGSQRASLLDPANWPITGPRPNAELLREAQELPQWLAAADARYRCIIGYGHDTVVAATNDGDEFRYRFSRDGDGTVAVRSAELHGADCYYARCRHSNLQRDNDVLQTTLDILRDGGSERLPRAQPAVRAPQLELSDSQLAAMFTGKLDWNALSGDERRVFIENLADLPPLRQRAAILRPAASPASHPVTVEVRGQDISDANADALAAAIFADVQPSGAVAAIDLRLGGVIGQFAQRRMLPGDAGRITAIPAPRGLAHARNVFIVGLGSFAHLADGDIEFAARNLMRFATQARLRSIATVPWGAGSGFDLERSVTAQLRGYLAVLSHHGVNPGLDRIVICVRGQAARRAAMRAAESLAGSDSGEAPGLRVIASGAIGPRVKAQRRARATVPQQTYLIVNSESRSAGGEQWRATVLTSGTAAAIITASQSVKRPAINALQRQFARGELSASELRALGAKLRSLCLAGDISGALRGERGHHLVVVHDDSTAGLPWEAMLIDNDYPALAGGVSRRYAATNLAPARFTDARRQDGELSVLLISNTTLDLPGAELERQRLLAIFAELPQSRVTDLNGRAATLARVQAELRSGKYDVLHFAGHARFNASRPGGSGIECSDGLLAGTDLARLARLPALTVFNACESGRLRRSGQARVAHVERNIGLAEAFLRGGVAGYVGTYWPVGDAAATAFGAAFYQSLLGGGSVGTAVLSARRAVRDSGSTDWADYLHYGDPEFRLKELF